MIYQFYNFTLNTKTEVLKADDKVIKLTNQDLKLLIFFVENPKKTFSKQKLISQAWQGRQVTKNSVDQSVSKLRKVLGQYQNSACIKTVYAKGFNFDVEVKQLDSTETKKTTKHYRSLTLWTFLVSMVLIVFYQSFNVGHPVENDNALLLFLTSENEDESLNQGYVSLIDEVMQYSDVAKLKDYKQKPEYLDRQQYLANQWTISPNLKIVTSQIIHENELFSIKLNIIDKYENQQAETFSSPSLSQSIRDASHWLAQEVNHSQASSQINSLIPEDSEVLEMYLQGLASFGQGEIDQAEHFFQLSIDKKPDFYLARLQLARVKSAQGKQEQGLAMLDTLTQINATPQLAIEIENVRGTIYNILGKDEVNRDLYLSVLDKHANQPAHQLNDTKYRLSFTYTKLTEFDKALALLNELENDIVFSDNPELLAHVLQKKASILQKMGHIEAAQASAEKSLKIFSQLADLLGEAKIHTTLARIATHQSKYKESVQHLKQSLNICKTLDYKLGIGATLNELIYVLMVQGELTQAWQSNQEMQKIAIDINYNAMLQISKQFSTDISRMQKKWVPAQMYLEEHLQLAQTANNKSALLNNKLLALDLFLDQEKTEQVETLINQVQKHIDESKEIRLQPRINKQLARYYLLTDKKELAMSLLEYSKELAKKTSDGESIVEINNLLAEQYLEQNNPLKALATLEQSSEFNPVAYPYLLLKSKASQLQGNTLKALDFANECKALSNEFWSVEDDIYLNSLIES